MPLDTELHKSAHKGNVQGVKDLVESGQVDVNEKGAQDRTALHRAAGANHVSIIQYLLRAGAPVDCADRCRRTPLHWACISGHLEATQLLLDSGGDLRCKTMSGMNPLMCAVQQRWHSVAEAILEWSAGCIEGDEDGQIPSPNEMCSTLDAEGKTAMMLAKENGDVPMQKLLKAYAPKMSPSTWCGSTSKKQLSAVVVPPENAPAVAAATAPTIAAVPSKADAGTTKASDGDGDRDGVGCFYGFPFSTCCGKFPETKQNEGVEGFVAPSGSAPVEVAAATGAAGGKVDESRRSASAGSGGIRNSGSASADGDSMPPAVSGGTRGDTDGKIGGMLAMNSPDSDNAKRLSPSSARSALQSVENKPLRDSHQLSERRSIKSSTGDTVAN